MALGRPTFQVRLDTRISLADGGPVGDEADSVIEENLDHAMQELVSLGATDPRIDAAVVERGASFFVTVEAPNPIDASTAASGLIRTAIHAAGGGTPDWPAPSSEAWLVRLLGVASHAVELV